MGRFFGVRSRLFLLSLALGLVYARAASAHHPSEGLTDVLAGLAHLPAIVWIILLSVLGLLFVALVVLSILKGRKKQA